MTARSVPEKFLVAFSFAGEQRTQVRSIASELEQTLGPSTVFLDEWYEFYIAGHDADLKLQRIYGECSDLVVVCVSKPYGNKPWTRAEHEAVRARLMQARDSTNDRETSRILPIRVGDGDIEGILYNTIVPDVRNRTASDVAALVLERLRLIVPESVPARDRTPISPLRAVPSADPQGLAIEPITSFNDQRNLIDQAITLYEGRIPADERFDHEFTVDLVRRHLADEFGPHWKMHLVVAKHRSRCVGMLIGYEDIRSNFTFISFLAALKPRSNEANPLDVSRQLAEGLIARRRELRLSSSPRFLFEIDDPALTTDSRERHRRLARFKLLDGLAPFEGLHLRALDVPYLQPKLEWPSASTEKQLLLCYAAPKLHTVLPKPQINEILTWVYMELYGDDVFEEPSTRAEYGDHIRGLLGAAVDDLPEQVRLLRYRELEKRHIEH